MVEVLVCPSCQGTDDIVPISKSKHPDTIIMECKACRHASRRWRFRRYDTILLPGEKS